MCQKNKHNRVPREVLKNFPKVAPQGLFWLKGLPPEKMQHLRRDQHGPDRLLIAVLGLNKTNPTTAICFEHRKMGLLPLKPQSPGDDLIVRLAARVSSPPQHQPLLAFVKIISIPKPERQGGEADGLVRGINEVVAVHCVELGFRIVVV